MISLFYSLFLRIIIRIVLSNLEYRYSEVRGHAVDFRLEWGRAGRCRGRHAPGDTFCLHFMYCDTPGHDFLVHADDCSVIFLAKEDVVLLVAK